MDVVCDKCNGKFKLPDEKIPKGQVFSVGCPKCKNKISIDTRAGDSDSPEKKAAAVKPEAKKSKALIDEVSSGSYDSAEKPFDFLEEGAKTALICESDSDIRAKIKTALENLGYHTAEPKSARDVLKQMRFHVFDMVVIDEMFDTNDPDMNNILNYLEQLAMSTRRNMFVALITERFRTADNMSAFNKSANIVVNTSNIGEIEQVLKTGLADNEAFYRVFKETLIKTGRA
jgi:CheY-like chemotaxis protein